MVSVKLLKPYFIKMNAEFIRIILAYQYFAILIDNKVYHFIPIEGHEILINRKTKRVVNTDTKFAFQHGSKIIYLTIKKLTTLDDFMLLIEDIIEPYEGEVVEKKPTIKETTNEIIQELEKENILRMIDDSLDHREERQFIQLVAQLKQMMNE